jgi:predicted dehydrogenase
MFKQLKKPLKLAFIGGGINSSIGKIHFIASQLDKNFSVEAGFFSRNKKTNIKTQKQYNINFNRIYNNLNILLINEIKKIDLFVILAPTPNHFKILKKLVIKNVNIIIEKPILSDFEEVKKLRRYMKGFNKKIYVVHNYTGYPAIREIQELVKKKKFGKLLNFKLQMVQESFLRKQRKDQKVKEWRRSDHKIPNLFLDLGIHLFNLSYFLTDMMPVSVLCDVQKIKKLVSDAKILLEYKNKTKAMFWISKSSLGSRNDLIIELFFEKCSIKWSHEEFESISINYPNGMKEKIDRSLQYKLFNENRYNRYRMGHPAGFIEAFANMYEDIARDFLNQKNNYVFDYSHAFKGIKFFDICTKSFKKQKWLKNINI